MEQASRDPLRGSLCENLVISEIAKGTLNRGVSPVPNTNIAPDGKRKNLLDLPAGDGGTTRAAARRRGETAGGLIDLVGTNVLYYNLFDKAVWDNLTTIEAEL